MVGAATGASAWQLSWSEEWQFSTSNWKSARGKSEKRPSCRVKQSSHTCKELAIEDSQSKMKLAESNEETSMVMKQNKTC